MERVGERTLDRIILPALGELAVLEATPERLQRFMDQVIMNHGPASARMCRAVLSGMLGFAVRNDAARTNAVRELERVSQRRDGATALSAEQLQDLFVRADLDARLRQLDLPDLLRFMAGTGCRVGEACAMVWDDVHPGAVHIHSTVVRIPGAGLLRQDHGKTQGSDRRIAIPEHVDAMLRRRAASRGDGELVFPSPLGNLRDPNNTQADSRDARDRIGFAGVKLHAFRKTVATLLDGSGLSARDVAEYLGHKNPSMTQDRYMGRNTGSERAAQALSKLTD
ncbi:site-specific integrase [Curtobacterium sp. VKM Ac-1395]|uniref:site-specific integrase n=1 Tax=Curtobacterium sp. VKM Ac-1395 TaxID=2783815 RepID=UPI00188BDA92|nr:site-specific integrase [Curtobacterium sp. VKM Ac-1395]MBF4590760.1 site-specific integrase [Curtobacterium sp. VKM Ac-1395]